MWDFTSRPVHGCSQGRNGRAGHGAQLSAPADRVGRAPYPIAVSLTTPASSGRVVFNSSLHMLDQSLLPLHELHLKSACALVCAGRVVQAGSGWWQRAPAEEEYLNLHPRGFAMNQLFYCSPTRGQRVGSLRTCMD